MDKMWLCQEKQIEKQERGSVLENIPACSILPTLIDGYFGLLGRTAVFNYKLHHCNDFTVRLEYRHQNAAADFQGVSIPPL